MTATYYLLGTLEIDTAYLLLDSLVIYIAKTGYTYMGWGGGNRPTISFGGFLFFTTNTVQYSTRFARKVVVYYYIHEDDDDDER